jgi:G3E family GTPase
VRAAEEALDADMLLSGAAFTLDAKGDAARSWFHDELARVPDAPHAHDPNRHGADIHAFALRFDRPLDWTVFGIWLTMLLNRHGEQVLRVKGILDVDGESAPVAIHGVQHLVHPPVHLRGWPDRERQSRIVFIVQGLPRAAIERSLRAFVGLVPA